MGIKGLECDKEFFKDLIIGGYPLKGKILDLIRNNLDVILEEFGSTLEYNELGILLYTDKNLGVVIVFEADEYYEGDGYLETDGFTYEMYVKCEDGKWTGVKSNYLEIFENMLNEEDLYLDGFLATDIWSTLDNPTFGEILEEFLKKYKDKICKNRNKEE